MRHSFQFSLSRILKTHFTDNAGKWRCCHLPADILGECTRNVREKVARIPIYLNYPRKGDSEANRKTLRNRQFGAFYLRFGILAARPQLASRAHWPKVSLESTYSVSEVSTPGSVHSVFFEATIQLNSVRPRSDPSCCARCGPACCARRPFLLRGCSSFSPRSYYAHDSPAEPLMSTRYSLGAARARSLRS